MNGNELKLLLTVARILRAIRSEMCDHYSQEDCAALDEAIAPWGAVTRESGCDDSYSPYLAGDKITIADDAKGSGATATLAIEDGAIVSINVTTTR